MGGMGGVAHPPLEPPTGDLFDPMSLERGYLTPRRRGKDLFDKWTFVFLERTKNLQKTGSRLLVTEIAHRSRPMLERSRPMPMASPGSWLLNRSRPDTSNRKLS